MRLATPSAACARREELLLGMHTLVRLALVQENTPEVLATRFAQLQERARGPATIALIMSSVRPTLFPWALKTRAAAAAAALAALGPQSVSSAILACTGWTGTAYSLVAIVLQESFRKAAQALRVVA